MLPLQRAFLIVTVLAASQAAALFLNAAPDSAAETAAKTVEATEDDAVEKTPAPAKTDPAAEKYWLAIKLLNSKQGSDLEQGRAALQSAADLEFPHAQSLLAECLMTGGYGFPKDKRKAANLYRLAAERGNAFAQVSLGQCYYSGTGVRKDIEKATQWLTKAVAADADFSRPTPPPDFFASPGNNNRTESEIAGQLERDPVGDSTAAAHFILGEIAASDKKTDEAQKHYVAAATAGVDGRSGIYPAAIQAALNYAFGQGTTRDMVKANEMLATSKKLTTRAGLSTIHNYAVLKVVDDFAAGDLEETISAAGEKFQTAAQFNIAETFTKKTSKDYNPAEAVKWYELAAENGNAWAMLQLAFIYSRGDLGKPDPAQAFTWFEKAGGGEKPKHYLALANLAICLNNGIGTAKDPAKAADLFKQRRNEEFICYLGSIGQCPPAVVTWDQRIKLIETWAKDKKDPQAEYFLATRYRDGWDGKPDLSAAVRWYKKAAAAGHGAAWNALGLVHEFNPGFFDQSPREGLRSALECYKKGGEAGDVEALASYANMLNEGIVSDQNRDEAERLYLRCLEIDPNHARAHNNLGCIYKDRLSDGGNALPVETYQALRKKVFEHFEAGVRLEYPYAALNLGSIYFEGWPADRDLRKAYRYYEQAAEWGLPQTHYTLGLMHERGQGVPVTYSEAAYHYRLAALEGHLPSLRRLIDFYISGKTGAVDLDRAFFWLNLLARTGDQDAITTIADLLLVKKEYGAAIKLLKQLADEGSPYQEGFACERLSRCYAGGLGVKANPARAKKYLDQAIKLGDGNALSSLAMEQIKQGKTQEGIATLKQAANYSSDACYCLGQLYFFGTYIEKDQAQALRLMRNAAERNLPEALIFLAGTTYNHVPGAPSIDEAIRFAQQAEANGDGKAKSIREKLERRRNAGNNGPDEETARARSS